MHPAIRPDGVAAVTGAAAGIGYAIAARLADEQMIVVMNDKDSGALAEAAKRLRIAQPAARLIPVAGNVADAGVRQHIYDEAFQHGEVAMLVNNAAIMRGAGPWEAPERWSKLMEVNFNSILHMQQLFVPRLLSQPGYAAVVNLGSKEGITTPPGNAAYAVSKAAVRVLTEQLAHELRQTGERVSAHLLIPGYTFTPMNFPGIDANAVKPAAPWSADQVVQRMLDGMSAGDFYLFCEDNEVTRELDQRRLQWSADDLILNRPALSRWHPEYRTQFAEYVADLGAPRTQ